MNGTQATEFVDRRGQQACQPGTFPERRQFGESRELLADDVRELAEAIDAFKITHHRRYVTLSEVMEVVKSLGYHK